METSFAFAEEFTYMIRQNLEVSSYLETVAKSCMNVYMNADKILDRKSVV